ncbi:chromosome segregation SMC common bacterial type [Pyrenophora seminiperda CCB06]|uniref:Chromosome segregation SMC common bacterial type n=1 Tax=Pyrenophora seminiperda CCB06 TaxID=1302712 RepID=A0A3M7LX44_9PLEO|nr:chromosome segregation SMC common bacterial type [Pyrenophora seminiperda CCB06]
MPPQTPCPISEVDRALSSYVNSREDTLKIRRTLSKYLTSSLRPVTAATQNQHLNHECPQGLTAANTNPPGLKDTRLDYLQALRARNQAQARHGELQASLEQLRDRHVDENPTQPESEYDNDVTRSYVSLLRQRRRYAELQVIQESLEKLLSAKPSNASADPRDLVKSTIGEQPDLPVERLEHLSQADDGQASIFRLKQEVLEARAAMERAQAASKKALEGTREEPSLQVQVYALEQARNEIVDWVQGELAKMEEETTFPEDASPIKRPMSNAVPVDLASAETQVRESYNKYTAARASLLEVHASFQQPLDVPSLDQDSLTTPATQTDANETKTLKPDRPTTKLLPHLPHLAQMANNERSLLQQSVYLETQIASADQDMQDALLRLAGESHLLPAGSKDVAAWGKTAREAEAATVEFVNQKLQDSKKEVSSVQTIVDLCSLQGRVLEAV